MKNIKGWSNILSEYVEQTFVRTKTKIFFFFGNSFHTWKNACVRESVRTRGMGYGCGHSCRNMHIFT